jgi:hypothetical protein
MADDVLTATNDAFEHASFYAHECVRTYHDPTHFRFALSSFIQAARNVTFRLQAHKAAIPQFEKWYASWQEVLRTSPAMSWINTSRVEITKRQGLHTNSKAVVTVYMSYLDAPVFMMDTDPSTEDDALLETVVNRLPSQARRNAVVEIRRAWIADGTPAIDVLAAITEALRVLTALMVSLKEVVASGIYRLAATVLATTARPKLTPTDPTTRRYRADRTYELNWAFTLVDVEQRRKSELEARYGFDLNPLGNPLPESVNELAELLCQLMTRILEVDGEYVPTLWLRCRGSWQVTVVAFPDKAAKFHFWHTVAQRVEAEDIDAVVFASEAWTVVGKPENLVDLDLGIHPERGEMLTVAGVARDGTCIGWERTFERDSLGRPRFASNWDQRSNTWDEGFLSPVRRAWGLVEK